MAAAEPYAVTVLKHERARCADELRQKEEFLDVTTKVTESEIRHFKEKLIELDAGLARLDPGKPGKK